MTRVWPMTAYKEKLDAAIAAENWDLAERIRVAFKRRILEKVQQGGCGDEVAAARDALADSMDRLRLSKRLEVEQGALAMLVRIAADAETAGIAADLCHGPRPAS